jgi:hypothetical protein
LEGGQSLTHAPTYQEVVKEIGQTVG